MPPLPFALPVCAAGGLAPDEIDRLVEYGWCRKDAYLTENLTRALAAECAALRSSGGLRAAGIGRGAAHALRPDIRSDEVAWLKPGQSVACERYLAMMDTLRRALNASLYLGLEAYESHFAHYPPGAFYAKHVDRFRDDDTRILSVVLYLNADWTAGDGGALRLYPAGRESEEIVPIGGRIVLFLSADMPHEVMRANRDRMSIAGWFRRRGTRVL
jgi:SM-20-related protein